MSLIGASVRRKEDPSLLVGRGRFVDDMSQPGTLFAKFVRSTEAHALVTGIDTSAAESLPGVHAVLTGADIADLPATANLPDELAPLRRRVLADGRVRFVGEPVAVVVAQTRAEAEDAVEDVVVDYEPLEALPTIEASMAAMSDPEGTRIHPDLQTNALPAIPAPEEVAPEFVAAPRKGSLRIRNNRCAAVPIEPFACLADWSPDGLTLWASVQAPHFLRTHLCEFFGIGKHECRVIAPDVGGGFGNKISLYPELYLAPLLSRRLGRPVRFTLTRSESMVLMCHGRSQVNDVDFGFDDDGRMLAIRLHTIQDNGAYPDPTGMGLPVLTTSMAGGCYAVPVIGLGDQRDHQRHARRRVPRSRTARGCVLHRARGRPRRRRAGPRPRRGPPPQLHAAEPVPLQHRSGSRYLFYDSGDYAAALDELLRIWTTTR